MIEKLIVKNVGVLKNIEIEIKDLTVIFGENGCGKSLLLDIIEFVRSFRRRYGDVMFRSHWVKQYTSTLDVPKFVTLIDDSSVIEYYIDGELGLTVKDDHAITEPVLNKITSNTEKVLFFDEGIDIMNVTETGINDIIFDLPEREMHPKFQARSTYELISQMNKKGAKAIIATHSPYIPTLINNCIVAAQVIKDSKDYSHSEVAKRFIENDIQIDIDRVSAYNIDQGVAINTLDLDTEMIDADVIDRVSITISEEFGELLECTDITAIEIDE